MWRVVASLTCLIVASLDGFLSGGTYWAITLEAAVAAVETASFVTYDTKQDLLVEFIIS